MKKTFHIIGTISTSSLTQQELQQKLETFLKAEGVQYEGYLKEIIQPIPTITKEDISSSLNQQCQQEVYAHLTTFIENTDEKEYIPCYKWIQDHIQHVYAICDYKGEGLHYPHLDLDSLYFDFSWKDERGPVCDVTNPQHVLDILKNQINQNLPIYVYY